MSKTGRPRSGSLYLAKSGWRARVTVEVDGENVQKSFDLETKSKAAARIKLKRLLNTGGSAEQAETDARRLETFQEAAFRIVEASTIRTRHQRLARLERHAFELIGAKSVAEVTASDVREVLAEIAAKGLSRQVCIHARNDIGAVLGELWREEILPENVVAKVKVPAAKVDTRERAVLTDHELAHYLAWKHPDPRWERAVLERQTMACVARMFGGLRFGDILAMRWESMDASDGRFEHGWAPRKKTSRPQLLEVPELLRPILRDWWERHGRPLEGLMFPTSRGERAGKERVGASVAKALRRDLRRALGIDVPHEVQLTRANGRADTRIEFTQARPLNMRERELFEDGEHTRPVDFHSFRRAYKQALADAGVEIQTAMALSGASDAKAHQRYLANTSKMRRLPAGAVPTFSMAHAETPVESEEAEAPKTTNPALNMRDPECRKADLNRRQMAYEAGSTTDKAGQTGTDSDKTPELADRVTGGEAPHAETPCLKSPPEVDAVDLALGEAIRKATAEERWELVAQLATELRARREARVGVVDFQRERAKRGRGGES